MKSSFEILEFDSSLFGYKTARILSAHMSSDALKKQLHTLQNNGVKLVYWFLKPEDNENHIAIEHGASLVDNKVTYGMNIEKYNVSKIVPEIHPYTEKFPSQQLISLSIQCGEHSRFKVDPHFRCKEYERLYSTWIEKSVAKEIDKEVLVYTKDAVELGLITLGIKDGKGTIGLFSVDEQERGKQIGKKLMNAAVTVFSRWGIKYVEVMTQHSNTGACRFYEQQGLGIVKMDCVYHFWL